MIKAYEIRVTGVDKVIRNLDELKAAQRAVTKEMQQVAIGSKRYKELAQASAELKATQRLLSGEINKTTKDLIENSRVANAAEGSYVKLKARLKALENEYRLLGTTAEDTKRKLEIGKEARMIRAQLKELDRALGKDGLTGSLEKALTSTKTQIGSIVSIVAGGLIVGAIQQVSSKIRQLVSEGIVAADKQLTAEEALLVALKGRVDIQQKLIDQAADFQNTTLFSDEDIIRIQALAVNLGVSEDQMQDFIKAVLNVSTVTGADLTSAAKNIGKTFSGLKGELGELVPQLGELTKEELKAGKAVELLNDLFVGQAEAAAKSGAAVLKRIKIEIGDIAENIGIFILDILNSFNIDFVKISDSIDNFFEKLRNKVPQVAAYIKSIFVGLSQFFVNVVTDFQIFGNKLIQAYNTIKFAITKNAEAAATIAAAQARINELSAKQANVFEVSKNVYRETLEQAKKLKEEQDRLSKSIIKVTDTQDKNNKKTSDSNKKTKQAQTEVQKLRAEQSALNSAITDAIIRGEEYSGLLEKLIDVNNRLSKAHAEASLNIAKAAPKSIASLQAQASALDSLIKQATNETELQQLIAQRAEVEAALTQLEQRIEKLKLAQAGTDADTLLEQQISGIEKLRDIAIAGINEQKLEEEERVKYIESIERDAQRRILEARLSAVKEGSAEEAAIIRELSELEIEQYKNITEEKKKLDEEWADAKAGIADSVISFIFDSEKTDAEVLLDSKLSAIEKEYDARISAAEGDAEKQKQLEKEKEAAIIAAQKEAGKKKQRIAITEAIINAALAATKTLANLGIPAALPALTLLAIQTALQIATIASQKFAFGGFTGKGFGAPDETGEIPVGVVHAGEYVAPKKVVNSPEAKPHLVALERLRAKFGYTTHPQLYASGGFVKSVTPAGNTIVYVNAEAKLRDEDIDAIAGAVAAGAMAGTKSGVKDAQEKALVEIAREQRLEQNLVK